MRTENEQARMERIQEKIEFGDKAILASENMSDEDIQREIFKDMMNLELTKLELHGCK